MSVLFIVLPLALLIAAVAVVVFVRAVRGGQFDDLDTPPVRMLHDDDEAPRPERGGAGRSRPRHRASRT